MGDEGRWGLFFHTYCPHIRWAKAASAERFWSLQDTSPHPLIPISRPGLGVLMKIFANLASPHSYLVNRTSVTMAAVFQHCVVGEQNPMKTRRPLNYLRSYRLRWGLSQGELANLLGCKTAGVISQIEKKLRAPTLKIMVGCFVIFGATAADVFPDISAAVETDVMERVWELYDNIQGDSSRKTKMKIQLLESAIERAKRRTHEPRV